MNLTHGNTSRLRPRTFWTLCVAHVALLALASTNFSIVSWLWQDWSFQFNAYDIAYRNGWGFKYESPFPLAQIACYIAAYMFGYAFFFLVWRAYRIQMSVIAAVLCALGALTFVLESTHWILSHNLSFIASIPGLLFVICMLLALQIERRTRLQTIKGHTT